MADLVVYLRANHMEVVNLKDSKTASGTGTFTTSRLLVGDFLVARELLRSLVEEVDPTGFLPARRRLLIQPLEMTEGGLSTVEERIFLELAAEAGARHARIYVGPKLGQRAALEKIDQS